MDRVASLPTHVPEQIALYQGDHLLTHDVLAFDPIHAASRLQHDATVVAVDLGGDKIRRAEYTVRNGRLIKGEEQFIQSRGGAGYLAFLEDLAAETATRDLRVGISSATKLEGSVVTRTVNIPVFFDEFRTRYGADYRNLFPGGVAVANDTITGICGASTLLALNGSSFQHVAFFICASGVGASVIHEGRAIHVEAAHVPLADALNPLAQTTPCNVEGKTYVCLERVAAARAGIENLYRQRTGESADGVTLGQKYEAGDPLATTLYETSSLALAHATAGVMERYGFGETRRGVVVYHGGNFEIPTYRIAVTRKLGNLPVVQPQVVFSRDLSPNVCLDGAAVLAIYDPVAR